MPRWISTGLRLIVISVVFNAALYLVIVLFGLPGALHSVVGAGLIGLAGLLSMGSSGGAHLAEKAQVRAVTARDLKQYSKDLRESSNAGIILIVVGLVTLGLGILIH